MRELIWVAYLALFAPLAPAQTPGIDAPPPIEPVDSVFIEKKIASSPRP